MADGNSIPGPRPSTRRTARVWLSFVAGTVLLFWACVAETETDQPPRLRGLSGDSLFHAVEQILLNSEQSEISFEVVSEGAFAADLRGELSWTQEDVIQLTATGTFGEDSVNLQLVSDGATMRYGNTTSQEEPAPDHLRQSLVVGLMRMGILHNLARLVSESAPDHAAGGVAEWVQVRNLSRMDEGESVLGVRFDIFVEGEPSGSATLQVDELTGETIVRHQTVQFPDGEMRVIERYGG